MKKLISIIFIIVSLKLSAQTAQVPIIFSTLTQMETYTGSYFQGIVTDSATGGLFAKKASVYSADNVVTFPCAVSGFLWFKLAASPVGNFVTLNTPQTILATARKDFKAEQIFDSTVQINFNIDNNIKTTNKNTFTKVDSVDNIGSDFSNVFRNLLRDINNSHKTSNYLPGVVSVNQSLSAVKQQDTLPAMNDARGSFTSFLTIQKRNSGDDTLNITNLDSSGSYKVNAFGFTVNTDSAIIAQNTTWFNNNFPVTYVYGNTVVAYRGYIKNVTDADLGTTIFSPYAKASGSTNFTIGTHTGLKIQAIKTGLGINQIAYAVNQIGTLDTVLFAGLLKFTSVTSSGTIASTLNMDANGNLIKKTYLPTVSAVLDFPSTTSTTVSDLTVTVTGAALGDPVFVGVPNAAVTATASYFYWVSSANTVTIRYSPKATENPASGTFNVSVQKP